MDIIEKGFGKLEVLFLRLSQIALVIMMTLTTFDALSRHFFSKSITGAYEVTEMYLMVMLVFLSMSYVQKVDGHIRLDIIFERLSKRVQDILNIIFYLLAAAMMFFIGYQGFNMTLTAMQNNLIASGLINFPLWLSYIWIPIGSFLIMIRLILLVVLLGLGKDIQASDSRPEEVDFE
ncbi:TRAP transporter small permease [Psychrobacillus soli]|uniref:TRAP transporter small permease n=1 Tax=Psychrobacillus soli TaxID=1543965 RepID=A0A544T4D4_9BACI|nr:TRAP transporter small permease [Psychrobacillus soli]TQR12279.1 TRAP transporter small permease [Psychrobacillus soli]